MYFIKGAKWEAMGTIKPYGECQGRQKKTVCIYATEVLKKKLFWGNLRNRNMCRTFVEGK